MVSKSGTVAFADPKEIYKKNVRGMLRKRAKNYDSDNSDDADKGTSAKRMKKGVKAANTNFQQAFKSIIKSQSTPKQFSEDKQSAPILSKYKAPINKAEESKRQEDLLRVKKQEKEQVRAQGRKLP